MLLANRILYACLGLLTMLLVMGLIWPVQELPQGERGRVRLPAIDLQEKSFYRVMKMPVWNVFDPKGLDWKKITRAAGNKSSTIKDLGNIKGIIRIPGFAGVLTDQGFVRVGEGIAGGRLVAVEDGVAIVDISGKKVSVAVDKSREKRRRQFKSLGFPFLQ